MRNPNPLQQMQIDVIQILEHSGVVKCNLYTGDRCVTVLMKIEEYELLIKDGFFLRNGKTKDSAGVLNTTWEYQVKP